MRLPFTLMVAAFLPTVTSACSSGQQASTGSTSTTTAPPPTTTSVGEADGSSQIAWTWAAYESEWWPYGIDAPAEWSLETAELNSGESFTGDGRTLEIELVEIPAEYPLVRWAAHAEFALGEGIGKGAAFSRRSTTLSGMDATVIEADLGGGIVRTVHAVDGLVGVTINWYGLDTIEDEEAFERVVQSFRLNVDPPDPIDYSLGTFTPSPTSVFDSFAFTYDATFVTDLFTIVAQAEGMYVAPDQHLCATTALIDDFEESASMVIVGNEVRLEDYQGLRSVNRNDPDVFSYERGCPSVPLFWTVNPLLADDSVSTYTGDTTYLGRPARRYTVDTDVETGEWLVDIETGVLLFADVVSIDWDQPMQEGFGRAGAAFEGLRDGQIKFALTEINSTDLTIDIP